MKKLFIILGLTLLVSSNVFITSKSDRSLKLNSKLINYALADDEGGFGLEYTLCYTSFEYYMFSTSARCNPCCILSNSKENSQVQGDCVGWMPSCPIN